MSSCDHLLLIGHHCWMGGEASLFWDSAITVVSHVTQLFVWNLVQASNKENFTAPYNPYFVMGINQWLVCSFTGGFPSRRASNAESTVSLHHHEAESVKEMPIVLIPMYITTYDTRANPQLTRWIWGQGGTPHDNLLMRGWYWIIPWT